MGDIADQMVEFEEYHTDFRSYKKRNTTKSKMNGIHKYLNSKGLKECHHTRCINSYLKSVGVSNNQMKLTFRQKSWLIQQDFGKFVQWYSQLIRLNKHVDF
jgi:ribosomal protein S15P/S13E